MLGNYLQQTTSADVIFQMHFFLGALRVKALCMLANFSSFSVVCRYFSKLTFHQNYFRNTIRVSNSLDPDQVRRSVGPDLGPNGLRILSADNNICRWQAKSNLIYCRDSMSGGWVGGGGGGEQTHLERKNVFYCYL